MQHEFYVAGVQFRLGYQRALETIQEGDSLDLIAEPTNQYDPNAVQVHFEGIFLGYVPKALSGLVAEALRTGNYYEASLTKLNRDEKPYKMFKVKVEF